jgi:hypothetical protein
VATITKTELQNAQLRRSEEDLKHLLQALEIDGSLEVVDDEELPEAEPQLDEEGNELKDAEGNVILGEAPRQPIGPVVALEVEGEITDEESEVLMEQAIEDAERLPATHADLDKLAKDRGIDLSEANTVAEKQEILRKETGVS